jgi:hypothetical protein
MRRQCVVYALTVVGIAAALSSAIPAAGQSQSRGASNSSGRARAGASLKTPWGHPDLQGVWHVVAQVPLERPAQYAGREFLTDDEVAALDKQKAVNQGLNVRSEPGTALDVLGAYNAVFNSILKTGKRTSRIIDPKDGKIPPVTEEAQREGRGRGFTFGAPVAPAGGRGQAGQRGQAAPAVAAPPAGGGAFFVDRTDNPEDQANNRCLGVQTPFLPLNTAFAQGTVMRLVQSPKSVAIYMEDDHAGGGNRVIPLDGSPHLPSNIRPYLGDSRGHWEGNALVVETTNFAPGRTLMGANADTFKMTERFTRVDARNLRREITFEDPKTWTRPWTALVELGRSDDALNLIFESACHEGNYGLTGILIGARTSDKAKGAQ